MASELLTVAEVAGRLKVSSRHVWKLLSTGRIVEPLRLGRSVRWRADMVDQWVEAGCPNRDAWDAQRGRAAAGDSDGR